MYVTFQSRAWGRVTLAGDIAITLLRMAGQSGTLPGALLAGDIPDALARLERGLAGSDAAGVAPPAGDGGDDDEPPPVGLRVRAWPLVQLLTASSRKPCEVMWEEGVPLL